jgi:hypothetical protein
VVEHGTENAGVASSTLALGTALAKGILNIHIVVFKSERKWLSGRASPCQGEGRGFESHLPLHSLRTKRPLLSNQGPLVFRYCTSFCTN